MLQFTVVSPDSSAVVEVRSRLRALDFEEVDAGTADILIVAVGKMEGQTQLQRVKSIEQRERQGMVAMLSSRCVTDDWRVFLPAVPTVLSCSAPPAELAARLDDASDAAQRMELARTGQRRLSLLRESIEEVSMIDMRTGMYNRRFLLTRLREALSATRRYERPLTLCVFRIDAYEGMIQRYGNESIGRVIEALSDKLAASLRTADVQAWIASDEFALLLPETPADGAQRVVDRVMEQAKQLADRYNIKGKIVSRFSSPNEDDTSPEAFLERVRTLPIEDA